MINRVEFEIGQWVQLKDGRNGWISNVKRNNQGKVIKVAFTRSMVTKNVTNWMNVETFVLKLRTIMIMASKMYLIDASHDAVDASITITIHQEGDEAE